MDKVQLVGHSNLRTIGGEVIENHIGIHVDGEISSVSADSPRPSQYRVPVQSDSPDVARFLRRWANDIHETGEYVKMRNRPAFSDPKPSQMVKKKAASDTDEYKMVPCPSCDGTGYARCTLCDAEGWVTRRQADEWLESDR